MNSLTAGDIQMTGDMVAENLFEEFEAVKIDFPTLEVYLDTKKVKGG